MRFRKPKRLSLFVSTTHSTAQNPNLADSLSRWVTDWGTAVVDSVNAVGSLSLFAWQMLKWMFTKLPQKGTLLSSCYQVGVLSLPVVALTGTFIGMVLAVQSYYQFRAIGLATHLGVIINTTLVRELGPVLAATMLAGRVGGAMAAVLGTMRVTEQIDGIRALGADPIQYLVVPRFLACLLLIPLLTAVADGVGTLGGWWLSTQVLGVDSYEYWLHAENLVTGYDVVGGLFKSLFFGSAIIAVISCHRGFHCGSGAQGVGQAATQAFVVSFVVILMMDFLLGVLINSIYFMLWPNAASLL